jgi:hypothetical protein
MPLQGPLVLFLEPFWDPISGILFSIQGSRMFEFSQLILRYREPWPILFLGDFQVVVLASRRL